MSRSKWTLARHDFHFQNGAAKLLRDLRKQLFQTTVDTVNKNLPPILWAEDNMILATTDDMLAMMIRSGVRYILHIRKYTIRLLKNNLWRSEKRGRFHPHERAHAVFPRPNYKKGDVKGSTGERTEEEAIRDGPPVTGQVKYKRR